METKQRTTLTQGSVAKGMLLFALPIFVSNLFQQLYNAADSLFRKFSPHPALRGRLPPKGKALGQSSFAQP